MNLSKHQSLSTYNYILYGLLLYLIYAAIGVVLASYVKIIWVVYGDEISAVLYYILGLFQTGARAVPV